MNTTRYQHAPLPTKIYRWLRYKPAVPFIAVRAWLRLRKHPPEDGFPWGMDFRLCWRLASGMASQRMEHYYTLEEVKERMSKRLSK